MKMKESEMFRANKILEANKKKLENGEIYIESVGKLIKETDDITFEIRRLKRENENLTETNDQKINDLQKKLIETEVILKETLTKSNKDQIQANCGWAHWRNMPDQLILAPDTLEQIESKYSETAKRYIKTEKSLKLGTIKKDLTDKIIVLTGTTVKSQDRKFEYKYTGGNL